MKKIISSLILLATATAANAAPNLYTSMPFLNQVAIIDLANDSITTADVGTFPRGVKVSLDGTKVYVANSGDLVSDPTVEGSVSVIDVATGDVSTITLSGTGNSFNYIQFSPNGSSSYVTNSGDDSVRIIDVDTDAEIGSPITVGDDPQGMASNSTGSVLYVANRGDDTVSVIDATIPSVTDTITVGDGPSLIVVSPDDSKVYVSNLYGNTVSVIDADSHAVTATIDTDDAPAGLLISEDGATLYVVSHVGSTIKTYDTSDNSETGSVTAADPFLAAYNPDDSQIYVTGTNILPVELDPLTVGTSVATPGSFTFGVDIVGSTNPGASAGSSGDSGSDTSADTANEADSSSSSGGCSLSSARAGSASGLWLALTPLFALAITGLRLRKQS